MNSDTLISPQADKIIRHRFADYKRRNLSPNFRAMLRQRCRERVKAKRVALFDQFRSLQNEESVRNALAEVIGHDFREIKISCISNEKEVESMDTGLLDCEPLSQLAVSDKEKWILNEYDKLIESLDYQVDLESTIVCPVCKLGSLYVDQLMGLISCSSCSMKLPDKLPLEELERQIMNAVDFHGQFCAENPQFVECPDNTTTILLLLCSLCGEVQQIV